MNCLTRLLNGRDNQALQAIHEIVDVVGQNEVSWAVSWAREMASICRAAEVVELSS
jgi:hypothetical protein